MTDKPPTANPRRPAVFRMETDPAAGRPSPDPASDNPAPRQPKAIAADKIVLDEADPFSGSDPQTIAEAETLTPPPAMPRQARFSFARLAAGAFAVLVSLAVGLWTDQLVRNLFARADWLGWLAIAAVAVFLLALMVVILREVVAIWRLSAIQNLKVDAEAAAAQRKPAKARIVVARIVALTADKPETARGRAAIADMEDEIVDGPQLIDFAETELLAPLDVKARRLILNAARRVSVVTAVSPRAIVDLAYVLYESARLVRAMATLYGGRPGALGMMRLFRDVLAHLAVTTSIAVGDSVVQQVVGHGIASRLSSRLGEGVINGLMTARIGIAAMDLCRPMPFRASRRPGVGDFIGDLTRTDPKKA